MSYLKIKLEADRNIALDLEKAIRVIQQDARDVTYGIASGAQRLTWYGSCAFDDYKDVCKQLRQEDVRIVAALREVYRRNDVVLDMVEIYFRKKINKISEQGHKKIADVIIEKGIGYASDKTGKTALALVIARLITASYRFSQSHTSIINKTSLRVLSVLSFYGKIQTASLAARRLRIADTDYYFELYQQNLDLLYFLIEPEMSKIIYMTRSGTCNEDEIIFLLNEILQK